MAMIDRCKFIHNLTCEQASRRLGELESENESLREFAKLAWGLLTLNEPQFVWESMLNDAHALGIMGRK